jgi:hypothetical protein
MRTSLLVAAALLCGCNKTEDKPAEPAAKPAPAPTVPAKPGGLEIFVNDASVAKLAADQLAKWPRLDTLVPPDDRRLGTWQMVTIVADKSTEVAKPSANYPDMVPAVFPGEGGTAAFGMFDPVELAKHGKPGLRQDRVREIRIKVATEGRGGDHQGGTGEGTDPSKLVIAIKSPEGEFKLTGDQLLALPRQSQPGNEDTKGWNLKQLIEAAGVKKLDKVTALDASGTSLVLEKKELDDKNLVPFLKLNRQGSLRLRVMKKVGDGWQAGGDLRSLATIIVGK